MKKINLIVCCLLLTLFVSADLYGKPSKRQKRNNRHHYSNNQKPTVGAPLDGGILTVLGAAGVAYLVVRKKRKDKL